MGGRCSCVEPCSGKSSWTNLKERLQTSAYDRKANRDCKCVRSRPRCLRIRRGRRREKKVTFSGCTCQPEPPLAPPPSYPPQPSSPRMESPRVCRFTVDAYFS